MACHFEFPFHTFTQKALPLLSPFNKNACVIKEIFHFSLFLQSIMCDICFFLSFLISFYIAELLGNKLKCVYNTIDS